MGAMASQITGHTIVYLIVYSGADKKTSKLRVTSLCVGNSPGNGEFPAQMASNAENVSIWWRHHEQNGPYFAGDASKLFLRENCRILIEMSLELLQSDDKNDYPAMVLIMA